MAARKEPGKTNGACAGTRRPSPREGTSSSRWTRADRPATAARSRNRSPGPGDVHGPPAPGRRVAAPLLPRRGPLGAEATQQPALVPDRARVDRRPREEGTRSAPREQLKEQDMHRTAAAFAAALAAACSSAPAPRPPEPSAPARAAAAPPAVDEGAMDPSADPCDDFYQYACGGWMKANPIPPDKSRWTRSFDTVNEKNLALLRDILERDAAGQPDPADPYAKKAGDFYATCMDEQKAETASLTTLKDRLAAIDAVKDPKQIARLVGEMHLTGTRGFFTFRSIQDAKDARQVIGLADQGGLGLPDRDYYVKDEPKMQETRKRYQEFA